MAFLFLKTKEDLTEDQIKKFKLFNKLIWAAVILGFVTLYGILLLIAVGAIGYIPPFEELENPKTNFASIVYGLEHYKKGGNIYAKPVEIGKYFRENRTQLEFDKLPKNVITALIATEDIRFYKHSGIDFRALARVLVKTILLGQSAGGGSTISQQLAKNLYKMREKLQIKSDFILAKLWRIAIMKFQEWVTAVELERRYSKDEILAMYLNTVSFGHNAFGINSASKIFYNKTPDSLKIEEAATLIGLLRAPTYYSPILNPQNSIRRRNAVLGQVEKYQDKLVHLTGWKPLTPQQFDSLRALPLNVRYHSESHTRGIATYFREFLRLYLTAKKPNPDDYPSWLKWKYKEDSLLWETDPLFGWCNKNHKPDGKPYDLYSDGLKIYTTIDINMQKYAEQAVREHLTEYQKVFENHIKHRRQRDVCKILYSIIPDKNFRQQLCNKDTLKKYQQYAKYLKMFDPRLSDNDVRKIIYLSMRRSTRWATLRSLGKSKAEIIKSFYIPRKMSVFSWGLPQDSVLTLVMRPIDSILYFKKFLQTGFVSIEPSTGYVRAYVGGIDFRFYKYDHVTGSRRQVGSTFKPFVYTLAMMPGQYGPCYKVPNVPISFEVEEKGKKKIYTPKYSHSKFDGQKITLKTGLALSLNQISAWIIKQYGPEAVIEVARAMGIRSPLEPVYSLCVGAAEVRLGEMVAAYTTFANYGINVQPIFVTRIEDRFGNVLAKFYPKKRQAIDSSTAWRMIVMMRAVVDYGTSVRLRYKYGFTNDIAGKTGTTNDNSDGWFIGMVPKLVSGAWVGGEERSIRFTSTALGQGASMALPIWALYMQKVYKDPVLKEIYKEDDRFYPPINYDGIPYECSDIAEQTIVQEVDDNQLSNPYGIDF